VKNIFICLILVLLNFSAVAQIELSDGEKAEFLSRHNFFRKIVSVNELIWSEDLEEIAITEANKIAQNPYSADLTTSYGINLYRSSKRPSPKEVVNYWAAEQRYYHGEIISERNKMDFGHYTQLVWSQSVSIGCAISQTKGGTFIIVCIYSPKGNIIGQKPF